MLEGVLVVFISVYGSLSPFEIKTFGSEPEILVWGYYL